MRREFVEVPIFSSKWRKLGLRDSDLRRLQAELMSNPKAGVVMQGTGGLRKLRFAFEDRGKSGSLRVIYVDFEEYEKLYLITVYPKNEKENLTRAERNELREFVEVLESQIREKFVVREKRNGSF